MKCIICGKEISKSMYNSNPLCSQECFSENFWNETLADKSRVIIDQDVYYVGEETNDRLAFRGFGGRAFYIKMIKDNAIYSKGDVFKSTNLWSNGKIPSNRFNPDMNNAVFITKEEYDEEINKYD